MSFIDNILKPFRTSGNEPKRTEMQPTNQIEFVNGNVDSLWSVWGGRCRGTWKNYKDVIFFQFVKLLGNMFSDVTLEYAVSGGVYGSRFDAFKKWFDKNAFKAWTLLCYRGYVVVGLFKDGRNEYFRTLKYSECQVSSDNEIVVKLGKQDGLINSYAITSDVFDCFGASDKEFLHSYLELCEKYLNNSDIAIDSNGHLLFCSPEPENGHTSTNLNPEQKKDWEQDTMKKAEFEDSFVQPLFSNRPMRVQDVDLTNFDTANFEKLVKVMLIICGHFDIPSNQIPILESSSNRSLTSGNELQVGDVLKYKTFERILQVFVYDCAKAFNLEINYTINNNPNDLTTENINSNEN